MLYLIPLEWQAVDQCSQQTSQKAFRHLIESPL